MAQPPTASTYRLKAQDKSLVDRYPTAKLEWEKNAPAPALDRVEPVDAKVSIGAGPRDDELFSDGAKIGDGDGELVAKGCSALESWSAEACGSRWS